VQWERYTRNTEQALIDDGFSLLPDSGTGCTKTYFCASEDRQDIPYRYAVLIKNGNETYLVLIENAKMYVHFMQQIIPVSHLFAYFVEHLI
jgi:hypothetical protein